MSWVHQRHHFSCVESGERVSEDTARQVGCSGSSLSMLPSVAPSVWKMLIDASRVETRLRTACLPYLRFACLPFFGLGAGTRGRILSVSAPTPYFTIALNANLPESELLPEVPLTLLVFFSHLHPGTATLTSSSFLWNKSPDR